MIIFVAASLKEIFRLKTQFPWPRPEMCKRCQSSRVWKHGFVIAYFDGFSKGILIRRFRCDDCRCVMRMRPAGYFPRFQASIETIRSSLSHKILRKTYLIAIIDDHSRLIVHAWFYVSEGLVSYLKALEDALATRGLPRKLYVDNGPAFRSRHLEHITASLNIALIHARPYKPQGSR